MANCMTTLPLILVLCAVSSTSALQFSLNVNCGNSGTSADGYLGMTWVGDEQYIKSGLPGKVQPNDSLKQQLRTLRYFPQRKKNCYSFPGVGKGNKILFQAWFYYGNYDGLESPPTFDLLYNGNLWETVSLSKQDDDVLYEMIHVTKVDDISFCLARTKPNYVPFINSLEIKQLDHNMYRGMDTNVPLHLLIRFACGYRDRYIRYPDDDYDRIWASIPFDEFDGLGSLTGSSIPIIDRQLAPDDPPAAALQHAITTNSSEESNLTILGTNFYLSDETEPIGASAYYVNFYFLEMLPNASRSFDIFLDNEKLYPEPIDVPSGSVKEISIYNVSSNLTLVRADGSTLPPLLNAAEIFRIGYEWRDRSTDSSDVKALSYIQESYQQLQEWSGDPCLPTEYAWEWVGCSNDSKPQVTALNLSGYGLTGPLIDFSNLAALQTIDLHNNSLNGSIPEFLGNLPNLKQLNLADNQFSGSLPESLARNSKIDLNISDNNVSGNNISGNNVSGNNISGNSRDSTKKTNAGVVAGATIASLLSLLLLVQEAPIR